MSRNFFNQNPRELRFVPFDIETTGFKAGENDFVTTVVMYDKGTYYIWLNTESPKDIDVDDMKENIMKTSTFDDIELYINSTEEQMFVSLSSYLDSLPKERTVLTAFNGETYRGSTDFDLPFLRTRFFKYGLPWQFAGFWYSDTYEVFSQKNRFDTTVTEIPSVENLKKSEQQKFIDDMGLDIHYNSMNKAEIVRELKKSSTESSIQEWADKNGIENTKNSFNSFTKTQLKQFIDDAGLDISYNKLSAKELESEILSSEYKQEMVKEWYDKTNRSVGKMEMTTLEDIHEILIENKITTEWINNSPFKIELFDPFDPYEDSSEAVTGFENEDYDNLILHCLADVARTVNLTRMMVEYVSPNDYRPKTL